MKVENGKRNARQEIRQDRRLLVRYRPPGAAKDYLGFSANVSPHGLFIQGSHLEKHGSPISLEIELPTGKIRLKGVVAWTRWLPVQLRQAMKMGFGVRLTETTLGWELLFQDP